MPRCPRGTVCIDDLWSEANLSRIVCVGLRSELFSYTLDERALTHARLMDGKLLLVTNVADLKPEDVVKRYKSLADIEWGFRVLKSELEIGPNVSLPAGSDSCARRYLFPGANPVSGDA